MTAITYVLGSRNGPNVQVKLKSFDLKFERKRNAYFEITIKSEILLVTNILQETL